MGERFRLDPDRLDALAREVRGAAADDLVPARTGLEHVARALEVTWSAEAQRRFHTLFGNWIGELDRLGADLMRVETYLQTCASEYRRLDAERAGALENLPTRAAGGAVHVVRAGDSLWAIAQYYGVTVDSLRRANDLAGDVIVPGQVLRLPVDGLSLEPGHGQDPDSQQYWTLEIQPGDTLSAIAQRYGTTVEALMQANGLTSSRINAGQGLFVPRPTAALAGDPVPDLVWKPEAYQALSPEQIEQAEAAYAQLQRSPLDFVPAYLDASLQADTFGALNDYARYGAIGSGMTVGHLIWQAVGQQHGDTVANVLQQAHALAELEPGSITAALGDDEALIFSGPRVVDLYQAWAGALPPDQASAALPAGFAPRAGSLNVHGNDLHFTLEGLQPDPTNPASATPQSIAILLRVTTDGTPVIVLPDLGDDDARQ